MAATDRNARHAAVCGNKPGGASMYYLKESCTLKTPRNRRSTTSAQTSSTETPNTVMRNYAKFCIDQSFKLEKLIAMRSNDDRYPVELTDRCVQEVTIQVLSNDLKRQRDIPLRRKLEQAVRLHNVHMDETGRPEDKGKMCPQLLYEVVPMLLFHYNGVVATLTGNGRAGS